jgi:hypothetical protein
MRDGCQYLYIERVSSSAPANLAFVVIGYWNWGRRMVFTHLVFVLLTAGQEHYWAS